jgi:hypothetical protein
VANDLFGGNVEAELPVRSLTRLAMDGSVTRGTIDFQALTKLCPRVRPARAARGLTGGVAGMGVHPAIVRAHSRALALSVKPGNSPPQLDRRRQLAVLLVSGADRGGIGFEDGEHPRSMGRTDGRRQAERWRNRPFASSKPPAG